MKRAAVFTYLLFPIALVLALFSAEVILRIWWDHRPFSHLQGAPSADWIKKYCITNALGYRGALPAVEKPPGTIRIVALGDSYTFGWGIENPDDRYTDLLGNMLQEATGKKVEVINLGLSGYNTEDELKSLVETGAKFDPDIVLVGYVYNDPESREQVRQFEADYRPGPWMRYLISKSYLASFGYVNAMTWKHRDDYTEYIRRISLPSSPNMQAFTEALAGIKKETSNIGADLVFVIFPALVDLEKDPYPYQPAQDLIIRSLDGLKAMYVDLLPEFKGKDGTRYWASAYDAHPNEEVHRIAAEKLLPVIAEMFQPKAQLSLEGKEQSGQTAEIEAAKRPELKITVRFEKEMNIGKGEVLQLWSNRPLFFIIDPFIEEAEPTRFEAISERGVHFGGAATFGTIFRPLGDFVAPSQMIELNSKSTVIAAGDSITIDLGKLNYSRNTGVLPKAGIESEISLYLVSQGVKGQKKLLAGPAKVRVAAGRATALYAIVPSSAEAGKPFGMTLRAEDVMRNVADSYDGRVTLEAQGIYGLPGEYVFQAGDNGVAHLSGLSVKVPGLYRIKVTDEANRLDAYSNPIEVYAGQRRENIYWGDIHCHQYDAVELPALEDFWNPAKAYERASTVYALDFLAVTSHIFGEHPEAPAKWWDITRNAAREASSAGGFAAFLGYEWRGNEGDYVVIFPDPGGEYFKPVENRELKILFDQAREAGAIVIPHVGGVKADLSRFDPAVQPLVEIASNHMNSEWFGQETLDKGQTVGFAGSSDDHIGGCGGNSIPIPTLDEWVKKFNLYAGNSNNGLVAAFSKDPATGNIFESLKSRNVYATTGARIILRFSVDGATMGSIIESKADPQIAISVRGTENVDYAALIRNKHTIKTWSGMKMRDMDLSFIDKNAPGGMNAYYVRIVQEDEETAWSSPVYVRQASDRSESPGPAWNEAYPAYGERSPDAARAAGYSSRVVAILQRAGVEKYFDTPMPVKFVHSVKGDYAVFYTRDRSNGDYYRLEYMPDLPLEFLRIRKGLGSFGGENTIDRP